MIGAFNPLRWGPSSSESITWWPLPGASAGGCRQGEKGAVGAARLVRVSYGVGKQEGRGCLAVGITPRGCGWLSLE